MGLEGYLEDLGISDILQIISLSKKSGTLSFQSRLGQGEISFIDGQVVRAACSQYPETLGTLLLQVNLISEEQLNQALERQKQLAEHRPLGELLTEYFQISREAIEAVAKQRIEMIVLNFFRWTEGRFSFLLETPRAYGSTAVNMLDFMLDKGISPQWLAVKGEKIIEQGEDAVVDETDLQQEFERRTSRHEEQELTFLKGMLAELENPFLGGGIILLILRYASEIMNRAIIFDVRGKQLVGLGQFGLSGLSVSADEIVRRMRLDIEEQSTFGQALQQQTALKTCLGDTQAERTLCEVLGGAPEEVFLGPLVSDGKVVALLYGDNHPHQQKIVSTKAFEVFLSQAGLAMEQALQK